MSDFAEDPHNHSDDKWWLRFEGEQPTIDDLPTSSRAAEVQGMAQQQSMNQSINHTKAKVLPVIHTEPDVLKAEAVQRLKHYTMQEEKLEHELARIRQMKHACQMMLNAFDQEKASSVDDY